MIVYTINDLENITGVKAHTIRIWEKRYNLLTPQRTDNNKRHYTDDDLQKLMNIVCLYNEGYKISKIAKMDHDSLCKNVSKLSDVAPCHQEQLDSLTLAMLELNESKFKHIAKSKIEQKGFEHCMTEVLLPLVRQYREMELTASVNGAHECFLNHLIRELAIVAIEKLPLPKMCEKGTFLMYLPDNNEEELTLYFNQYLIKKSGFRVVNLGDGTRTQDVVDALNIINPGHVMTVLNKDSMPHHQDVKDYLVKISNQLGKDVRMLIYGLKESEIPSNDISEQLSFMTNIEELKTYLSKEYETLTNCED